MFSSAKLLDRLRMRTTLLVPLLFVFLGWTLLSLLILRVIVEQQTRNELTSDLSHSISTYQNLQRQHHDLMQRQAMLIADLPTIKALMTSNDRHTIEDGGVAFWRMSNSDLFVLFDSNLNLAASYLRGDSVTDAELQSRLSSHLRHGEDSFYADLSGTLYEVAAEPIIFGDRNNGSLLGYLIVGYKLDRQVAHQVSEAAAAEVLFFYGGHHLVGTLRPELHDALLHAIPAFEAAPEGRTIWLGGQRYLATARPLMPNVDDSAAPQLIVLKSFEQGQALLRRVNRWFIGLSLPVLCVGTLILLSVSRSITRPLQLLMQGVRAMAAGDYTYHLEIEGAEEVRELSRAFDRMRTQLEQSQKNLLQSERLATIGRMASSISHDLRHHLSAIYANAEFMCDPKLSQAERDELLTEVTAAVRDMTDLLESLLLFSQTGKALQRSVESLYPMIERSISALKSHPAARDVKITMHATEIKANVDSRKLGRAVYNLLLNGCEAAGMDSDKPEVVVTLSEDDHFIRICISDNGNGVPESVRQTMFMPFVSEGKHSGTGLGLTLAEHIASEHGGFIQYERMDNRISIFSLVLPKDSLQDSTISPNLATMNLPKVTP